MTIAEVQAKNTGGSATTTLSAGTGAGNTVFLAVYAYGTTGGAITASAPKVGGSAYAAASQVLTGTSPGTNNVLFSLWMFPALPSGATAFSVTVTGGVIDSNDGSSAWEFSGLGAAPAVDRSSTGSGTSGTVTSGTTAATRYAPELVLGAAIGYGISLTPPGSPWTGPEQPSSFCSGSYQIITSSGGTYTYTPSGSGNDWAAGAVTISAAQTPPVTLSGSGTMTATGAVTQQAAAAFSGSGTVTASGPQAGSAAFSGSGTVAATGAVPGTGLARDSSSPVSNATDDPGTQTATQVSKTFSPPAGSVIIVNAVAISSGVGDWSATPFAITDSLGSHLSWNLKVDRYDNSDSQYSERIAVFWAYCPSAQTGMTVSVTVGATTGQYIFGIDCKPDVWTGANTSGPVGAVISGTAASTSTLSEAITPTATGSALMLYGGPTFDGTANPAAGSGCYGVNPGSAAVYFLGEWYGTSGGPTLTPSTSPVTMTMTFTGPQTWQYVGYEVLAAPGGTQAGAAALTGTSAFSAGGRLAGAAGLAGTSAFAASGGYTAGAAFSGQGSLAGSGRLAAAGSLAGTGAFSAGGAFSASLALAGQGSLAGGGPQSAAAAPLTGTSAFSAAGALAGAAALAGTSAFSAAGQQQVPGGSAFAGTGTLAAATGSAGSSALAGAGTFAAGSQFAGAAVFLGTGSLAAGSQLPSPAAFAGAGSLAAAPRLAATAPWSGAGALAATGALRLAGSAALAGAGLFGTAGALGAAVTWSGSGALGAAYGQAAGAALGGSGDFAGQWAVAEAAGAALSGTGSLSAAYTQAYTAAAAWSGQGSLTLTGSALSGVLGTCLAVDYLAFFTDATDYPAYSARAADYLAYSTRATDRGG